MSVSVDNRGIVETGDGVGNLTVAGATVTNVSYMTAQTLPGSASLGLAALTVGGQPGLIAIPSPGFYAVPVSGSSTQGAAGQGGFTGSLPNAATYPGGEILVTDTVGLWAWLITGSMSSFGSVGGAGGSQALSSSNGTHLVMSAGGTVGFWSDSKSWLICALSGSATLKP